MSNTLNTMYGKMRATALRMASAPAVDFMGSTFTYRQLLDGTDRTAAFLASIGLKKGDVVTICLPNMPTAATAFYGVNKLGITANIVHPLVPTAQLTDYMARTNSKVAFVLSTIFYKHAASFAEKGYKAILCSPGDCLSFIVGKAFSLINRKALKQVKYGRDVLDYKTVLKFPIGDVPENRDDEFPTVYLHSGGTTGIPKTIMLSDRALNKLAERGKIILDCENPEGKGMLAVLPLFHGFGLCMCMHTMFVNGVISVMLPQFDVKQVIKAMKRGRVQMIAGVPTMFEKLLSEKGFHNKHLKDLEFVFCGGDTMPQVLKERFDGAVKAQGGSARMLEGYGLTETVTVCCVNTYHAEKAGSVGKPLPGMEVKAVGASGERLNAGQLGELAVSADTVMLGYLGDEAETARVLTTGEDGKKWVVTGDYGYVDEEGFVFFKQRLKRIVKVSGVAVFPSEIEDEASKVENVLRCCAIGVPHEKTGHTVLLFVELRDKAADQALMTEKITSFLKERLIKWAVPRKIVYLDKLPLTLVGKVDSRKIEEQYFQGENNSIAFVK